MTDPRIIPDEELAKWLRDAIYGGDTYEESCSRIISMNRHIDALTEQMASSDGENERLSNLLIGMHARAEKAEAEREQRERQCQNLAEAVRREGVRADGAVQRLADRDKAITPEVIAEVLAGHRWHHTRDTHCACGWRSPLAQLAVDGYEQHVAELIVRALLTEDGACSTCEGTGRVDWAPGQQRHVEDDQQPCPDCTSDGA